MSNTITGAIATMSVLTLFFYVGFFFIIYYKTGLFELVT